MDSNKASVNLAPGKGLLSGLAHDAFIIDPTEQSLRRGSHRRRRAGFARTDPDRPPAHGTGSPDVLGPFSAGKDTRPRLRRGEQYCLIPSRQQVKKTCCTAEAADQRFLKGLRQFFLDPEPSSCR